MFVQWTFLRDINNNCRHSYVDRITNGFVEGLWTYNTIYKIFSWIHQKKKFCVLYTLNGNVKGSSICASKWHGVYPNKILSLICIPLSRRCVFHGFMERNVHQENLCVKPPANPLFYIVQIFTEKSTLIQWIGKIVVR